MNQSVHNAVLAFNYSFDYTEFDTDVSKRSHPHVLAPALKSMIIIATFTFMAIIIAIVVRSKPHGHRAFRWYTVNLLLINFLMTISVTFNEKELSFLFKDNLSNSLRARSKQYHFNIVELSNVVYCSTTFFLITDSTNRYRRNSQGFTSTTWLAITLLCDCIPFFYIVIQQEFFAYVTIIPKPLAVYHIVWWLLCGIAASTFITGSLCCLRKRKLESYASPPIPLNNVSNQPNRDPFSLTYAQAFHSPTAELFDRWHLVRLSLYLISTMWIQFTTGATIGPDLFSGHVDPKAGMKLMPVIQVVFVCKL
ncbi:hypothetical protein M3Y95_01180900 [Aphelenchoides besseyi]|nr:hypothetical protein M3Y95_01180900 [Aphelenchoides besseyi]